MTNWRVPLAAFLIRLAALVGCDAGGSVDGGLDDLPTLAVASDMRLDSFDDPTFGFTSVTDLDVDADGRTYVLDRSQQEIRWPHRGWCVRPTCRLPTHRRS